MQTSSRYGSLNPLLWPRRAQAVALVVPVAFILVVLASLTFKSSHSATRITSFLSTNSRCTPSDWAQGSWVQRPRPWPTMSGPHDVFRVSGFSGCASSFEPGFHLANDNASMWDWRAQASTYDWVPGTGCKMAKFDAQQFIFTLLHRGGWHLIGDSITESHFFSLSCMLHPYVRAAPKYGAGGWKRSWPQFLYLDVNHPWVKQQIVAAGRIPIGFDPELTPIISHRRIDLLFSLPELADLGAWIAHPTADPASFFAPKLDNEKIWTQSALDWVGDFDAKLPAGRYGTLIVSSGAHWLAPYFNGFKGEMHHVVQLWRVSMTLLVSRLITLLDKDESKTRVVIFRSAPIGAEGCLDERIRMGGPLKAEPMHKKEWYNWRWIPHMNDILDEIIRSYAHPRLHFLRLDRPGRLRPDAHALNECVHYAVGTGILEEWTRYISHFLDHEVKYRVR